MSLKPSVWRLGWGLSDQALSSLSNLALTVLVAKSVSRTDFGAFSLAFSTYVLAQGTVRAVASEPLLIRYGSASAEERLEAARKATGAGLVVGLIVGVACVVIGLLTKGRAGGAFLGLGIAMPVLLLQDTWRFTFVAANRSDKAFVNDLVWTAAMLLLVPALLVNDVRDIGILILAWGGSAGLASVVGVFQAKLVPSPLGFGVWWKDHRDLALRYVGEFMAGNGATQLTMYSVAGVSTLADVGALRAATVILGPVNVVFMGLRLIAIPESQRILRQSAPKLRVWLLTVAAALAGLSILWGAAATLVPARIGAAILSQSWIPAQRVIIPVALTQAASAIIMSAVIGLRTLAAARESLSARIVTSVLIVTLGTLGAALASAKGAAFGLALASALGAMLFWRRLLVLLDRYPESAGS